MQSSPSSTIHRLAQKRLPTKMNRLIVTIIIIVFIIPLGCAKRQYHKGNDRMENGQASAAIPHYQKAAKRKPDRVDYLYALGHAYVREGLYSKAVEVLRRAHTLDPNRTDVLEQFAYSLAKQQSVEEAIDSYLKLIALQKYPLSTFEKIRPLLESKERYSDAVDLALRVSNRTKFDVTVLVDIGREYHRLGKLKETERLYARALELKPDQAGLWRTVGEIRLKLNDIDGAARAFKEAQKQNPGDVNAAMGSAAVLRRLGRIDEALTIYEGAIAQDPDLIEPRAALVELFLRRGRNEEAAFHAREAYIRKPQDPRVQALKGAAHMSKGEYDKAIKYLELSESSQYSGLVWTTRMLGEAYLAQGERATARKYLQRALRKDPEDGATYLGLCRLDLENGREHPGIEHCQKAGELAPELKDLATAVMADFYERTERTQRAASLRQTLPPEMQPPPAPEIVESTPPSQSHSINTLRNHLEILLQTGEGERSPREWYEIGVVSMKLDDINTAEKAYFQAHKLEPDNSVYHTKMAQTLLIQEKFDSAVVHFKDIIRDNETDVDARLMLAQAYMGRGSYFDAYEVLKELRLIAPDNARVYELSAEAAFAMDMTSEGEQFQRQALAKRKAGNNQER